MALADATTPAAADSRATWDYLVTLRSPQGGALYHPEGAHAGVAFPYSYLDSANYWGVEVCGGEASRAAANCGITDRFDPRDSTLRPPVSAAGNRQYERVSAHHGTNLYDAATWQIAVMLGAVRQGYGAAADAHRLAGNVTRLLTDRDSLGLPAEATIGQRATTRGQLHRYGEEAIRDPERAFVYRMGAAGWLVGDPLAGSAWDPLIRAEGLPLGNPRYQAGLISWPDWMPVTGENAWAHLLGPLHTAYLNHVEQRGGTHVPASDPALRHAIAMLPAFAALQLPIGGIRYAPTGEQAGAGVDAANPWFVSVENNFSAYAGLEVLRGTLRQALGHESALTAKERASIEDALAQLQVMIDGGRFDDGRETAGLLGFFRKHAWRDGEFVQGGLANDPRRKDPWVPVLSPRAVDVTTWGIAALGADRIDEWFGQGAALRSWESLKRWGGYGQGTTLRGVGYSDRDGNGIDERGEFRQGVLSGEWTAGAILAVRELQRHYAADSDKVAALRADEQGLLAGLLSLRYDHYLIEDFPGKPKRYPELVKPHGKPYLYASRRHYIPFGWYANPLPSTASTSWAIFIENRFNPFHHGGRTDFPSPARKE